VTDSIYGALAAEYLSKGYSPLPLPPRKKKSPPDGYTGKDGVMASGPDVFQWAEMWPDANIALRLPKGVIGIDVDNYGGKQGLTTMRTALEQWGKLPIVGRLTSRYVEDELRVSGIRFFRVPEDTVLYDTLAAAGVGPDVEILQHHHRYALAPGSIHPDTDMPYEWIEADASTIGELPAVADLPELPVEWLEGLRKKAREVEHVDVDHAAYDQMDEEQRIRVDNYVERSLNAIREQFAELKALPDGKRTAEGHGWETGSLSLTASVASLVKADWNCLTVESAWAVIGSSVPSGPGFPITNPKSKLLRALAPESDVTPRRYPFTDDEIDLMAGLEDRGTKGKADGGTADEEEVTSEAKLVGGVQGHILFDTKGCRRIQIDDDGKKKEKELLPGATAKRLADSWPIAKQPLSKSQNWWVYKDGVWILNDSIVRLSMAASFFDAYQPREVAGVEDVLSTMADEIEVAPHESHINFANGMLNWRTEELADHDPKFKSTVQLPYAWNAEAECPRFDAWLFQRLDVESIKLAWELIAVSLYNGNPIQRAGLLFGKGGSGKSTYLEMIQGLIGIRNTAALSPQDMSKTVFATHSLLGKQTNIVTDIDPTKVSETAIFKRVVASEAIQAQQKNKPEFSFRPFCNHLFSANQIPRSSDRTSAWTRRFAILKFERKVSDDDGVKMRDKYHEVLLEEAEGIIAKAVRILPELLAAGDFTLVQASQDEFEEATDFTNEFWKEAASFTGDMKDFTPTEHIAKAFEVWCERNGYKSRPPIDDLVLHLRDRDDLKRDRGRVGGRQVRGWKGLVLTPEYRIEATDSQKWDINL
jgi:P4 family phage/plasmid primase-like protien